MCSSFFSDLAGESPHLCSLLSQVLGVRSDTQRSHEPAWQFSTGPGNGNSNTRYKLAPSCSTWTNRWLTQMYPEFPPSSFLDHRHYTVCALRHVFPGVAKACHNPIMQALFGASESQEGREHNQKPTRRRSTGRRFPERMSACPACLP